ncbi:hypothetical protein MRX96_057750 [Rhipicephalus microplus]
MRVTAAGSSRLFAQQSLSQITAAHTSPPYSATSAVGDAIAEAVPPSRPNAARHAPLARNSGCRWRCAPVIRGRHPVTTSHSVHWCGCVHNTTRIRSKHGGSRNNDTLRRTHRGTRRQQVGPPRRTVTVGCTGVVVHVGALEPLAPRAAHIAAPREVKRCLSPNNPTPACHDAPPSPHWLLDRVTSRRIADRFAVGK